MSSLFASSLSSRGVSIIEGYTFNFSYTGGEVVLVSHSMRQLGLDQDIEKVASCSVSAQQSVADVTRAVRVRGLLFCFRYFLMIIQLMTRTFVLTCQTLAKLPSEEWTSSPANTVLSAADQLQRNASLISSYFTLMIHRIRKQDCR